MGQLFLNSVKFSIRLSSPTFLLSLFCISMTLDLVHIMNLESVPFPFHSPQTTGAFPRSSRAPLQPWGRVRSLSLEDPTYAPDHLLVMRADWGVGGSDQTLAECPSPIFSQFPPISFEVPIFNTVFYLSFFYPDRLSVPSEAASRRWRNAHPHLLTVF